MLNPYCAPNWPVALATSANTFLPFNLIPVSFSNATTESNIPAVISSVDFPVKMLCLLSSAASSALNPIFLVKVVWATICSSVKPTWAPNASPNSNWALTNLSAFV